MRFPPSALTAAVVLACAPAAAVAANPTPPAVSTGGATSVERTSATLTATVDPNGAATTYRFEYGTSSAYGLVTTTATVSGDDPVSVSLPVTGLTQDTTYHYRVTATNAAGVVTGADRTLKTDPGPGAPAVSTRGVTNIRPTSATLTARINPRGQATRVYFQYGTSKSYSSRTKTISAGSGTKTVTARVSVGRLKVRTRYRYRVVAVNATGTSRGGDRSFVTLGRPTSVSLAGSSRSVRWNGTASVRGIVRGTGIGGTTVALERSDFPYLTGFREVARRKADSKGRFAFGVGPLYSAIRVRVVTRSGVVVTGGALQINNRAATGLRVRGAGRRTVSISGSINPAIPGGRISVQRLTSKGRWLRIRKLEPRPLRGNRSQYRVRVPRISRTARIRVVAVPADGGEHANGASRELRIARRR